MPRLRLRAGAGLPELIVALVLAAVVSAAAATALAGMERYTRASRAGASERRVVREAEAVLASELRVSASDSVRVRGDTAVDFDGLVGVSVACVSSGVLLVLPPDVAAGGHAYSAWRASPEAGDLVAVFDTAGGGTWNTGTVDTATSRSDGAGCTPATGLVAPADSAARRAATRIVLRAALAAGSARVGSPVFIMRPARYALTHSADGGWSLSYRRCDGGTCGTAQPVAGPLASPGDAGLGFVRAAGEGRLEARLRAVPAAGVTPPLSDTLRIALRNSAGRVR